MTTPMPFVHILPLRLGEKRICVLVLTDGKLSGEFVSGVFARQAIPMIWDFAESNPFSDSTGNWMAHIKWIAKVVERLPADANSGVVHQADASTTIHAKMVQSSSPIRPTTITSTMPTCPISSTCGCVPAPRRLP